MRQERPSVNWRRHLLLFESVELDCMGTSGKKVSPQRHGEHKGTNGRDFIYWDAASALSEPGAELYGLNVTA